ncbi:Sugar phosphate exchanger 2, partial [Tinamus guttatus]
QSQLHLNCSNGSNGTGDCSWAPFDGDNYKELFGALDNAFLVAYAVGMFISGIFGERLPLRYYLSSGMLLSGLFTALFGLGYFWNIHVLWYYIVMQICNGLVQTTGWPAVVACVGNWFGKGKRGLIMGVWNSHTSVGNIVGSLLAGVWVSSVWGLSFVVPGIVIASVGIVCFFFLVEREWLPGRGKGVSAGGIVAGLVSDYTGGRATTCCVMLVLAAPMLFLYNHIGQNGIGTSIAMLIVCGGLVNGPYALITTAVSADLGTHESLQGNAKALSTVTAIIDGTGSIGAALGPLLAGLISPTGWNNVFYMLITADVLACLLLSRVVLKETRGWCGSMARKRG